MSTQFSKIVLGTVQFGLPYGIANTLGQPSFKTVKEILTLAYDHGIDTLDTAASYGESEIVLGQALHELKLHGKMRLISKIPPMPPDVLPEDFAASSLTRHRLRVVCLKCTDIDLAFSDSLIDLHANERRADPY